MVRTIPQRQIPSIVVLIGASKKNIETKNPIGHINSDRTISQKTLF